MNEEAIRKAMDGLSDILDYHTKNEEQAMSPAELDTCERVSSGENIIVYGVPGCGKSWTIEHEYLDSNTVASRVVFHPDYSYSDFVGQLLPVKKSDGSISYDFVAGPFTIALKAAYHDPKRKHVLIIEELNRGNAPAVFGDIFQLLDRAPKDFVAAGFKVLKGASLYSIFNPDIATYVYNEPNHRIRLLSNFSIIASMNTSDQNVFTLDTAFQRRWKMRLIENTFDSVPVTLRDQKILDTSITWKQFVVTINGLIMKKNIRVPSNEDKRIGVYFLEPGDLIYDDNDKSSSASIREEYSKLLLKESSGSIEEGEKGRLDSIRKAFRQNGIFPEKVLKYLWDDAFKFNREDVFDVAKVGCLEDVIRFFLYEKGDKRFEVFKPDVLQLLIK